MQAIIYIKIVYITDNFRQNSPLLINIPKTPKNSIKYAYESQSNTCKKKTDRPLRQLS